MCVHHSESERIHFQFYSIHLIIDGLLRRRRRRQQLVKSQRTLCASCAIRVGCSGSAMQIVPSQSRSTLPIRETCSMSPFAGIWLLLAGIDFMTPKYILWGIICFCTSKSDNKLINYAFQLRSTMLSTTSNNNLFVYQRCFTGCFSSLPGFMAKARRMQSLLFASTICRDSTFCLATKIVFPSNRGSLGFKKPCITYQLTELLKFNCQ